MGKLVIMGGNTYRRSYEMPTGCKVCVISRTMSQKNVPTDVEVVRSIGEAIVFARQCVEREEVGEEVMVMGGEWTLNQFSKIAGRIYHTEIDVHLHGDNYFHVPEVTEGAFEIEREWEFPASEGMEFRGRLFSRK